MKTRPECRRSIIEVLRLLSSPSDQLAYERRVPNVPVTTELLSMWFDDTYLPESQAFRECFSKEELSALAAFNEFYDEQSRLLPEPRNGLADWLKDEVWHKVMRQASDLLTKMEP